jgi:hypothetical protein
LFTVNSKILICGGGHTCEGIDLESSATTCKNLPDLHIFAGIGGLGLKNNPIICGGHQNGVKTNLCFTLENNEWVSSESMISARSSAAATQLQDGKLLVTGGQHGYDRGSQLKTAEILTEKGWERNIPSLPVAMSDHCMVTVNSTTVMVIGGLRNSHQKETLYYTFGEERWTEGPALKNERISPSCGRIKTSKDSQEMSIIVVGGWTTPTYPSNGPTYLTSVEILDEGSTAWRSGPDTSLGTANSQMVEDKDGGVVLIGGNSHSYVLLLDTLYQLPHGAHDAVWTKMEQKLKTERALHTAFWVPDNIVDCS